MDHLNEDLGNGPVDERPTPVLRGLRQKWIAQRQARKSGEGDTDLDALVRGDFSVLSKERQQLLESPLFPEPDETELDRMLLGLKKPRLEDDVEEYPSPSTVVDQTANGYDVFDIGKTDRALAASSSDHTTSVMSSFLTGMKPTDAVLPWEQPWLRQIFGDSMPKPPLSMPASWNMNLTNPVRDVLPGVAPNVEMKEPFSIAKCVKNRIDRTYVEERAIQSDKAIVKMKGFLMISPESSAVGRQLSAEPTGDLQAEVLMAILGTRSPSTVVKRINSLLHFYRWHMISFDDRDAFPLQEPGVWDYVRHLHFSKAAPTEATSFIQALRFSAFVLQLSGAEECIKSRRLIGSAELQMSMKRPTRQARPLSVVELKKLRQIMEDETLDLQQRVLCSHLVMMVYTRSRTSDLAHVAEVLRDSARDREWK